jgi:hypothetical protein
MDLTKVCAARPSHARIMTFFRSLLALLLLVLLPLGLGGCLFDKPLTEWSSTDIDSRLLGVFEFKEGIKSDKPNKRRDSDDEDKFTIHRVAVLPQDANRYTIYYRDFGKKPAKTWKFTGWISRVDSHYYLTVRDETEGSETFGRYGFFGFDWEFPGNFLLFSPDMKEVDVSSSSYRLRVAVRQKLKDGNLFPYDATWWKKIARVWWNPLLKTGQTEIPPEFENGTKRENPGL